MKKSEKTRQYLLARGLELVSVNGLKGVSLGELADHAHLSKSGVYAHFGSMQGMQLALLSAAGDLAEQTVIRPAYEKPEGLPRLRGFFNNLLGWAPRSGLPGGCPFVSAVTEFDDLPGPVNELSVEAVKRLIGNLAELTGRAVALGHLREGVDIVQTAWQLFGIYAMHHTLQRLVKDPDADARAHTAFEMLLEQLGAKPLEKNRE